MDATSNPHDHVRTRVRFIFLFLLCVGALVVYTIVFFSAHETTRSTLRVVFFDVGQGDSIYIETPTGVQLLIDGGRDRSVLRALTREMGFFDRSLDMVVMTHEDLDHVGGLPDVFRRYTIGTFIRTENQGDSGAAQLIDESEKVEGARIVYARRDMQFDLGDGALLTILFPDRDPTMLESNTSSIVARLTYGESEFLFTGDSPQAIEVHLSVLDGDALRSDVLKAGHHGSRTSTSPLFLSKVEPQVVVFSSGKDNRYGHPHKEVTDLLRERNIPTLNTADEGSIAFESDGEEVVRVR